MAIEKIHVSVWNQKIIDHNNLLKRKRRGNLVLICDQIVNDFACKGEMEDQNHVDDSKYPHKRQVICCNCGHIDYRIDKTE